MARPIKNACDYFPHDNGMRNHRKIKALRNKFTNSGYCFYCMFLEYLTGADGNVFENSDIELELLSGDFGFSVTEITEMLNFCIMIELFFRDDSFIYSESLNERLAPVYSKRGKAKELSSKQKRLNGKYITEITEQPGVTVTETPQSKGKEIKVKKIKEKKERKKVAVITALKPCTEIYNNFILKQTNCSAKIDGVQINALKEIIKYLEKNIKEQPPTEKGVCDALSTIFDNYNFWDKFHQKNLKLTQINSDLVNIINSIKNYKKLNSKTQNVNDANLEKLKEWFPEDFQTDKNLLQ